MEKLKDAKTFCPHPWTSLTTSPSGQVRICCMGNRDLTDKNGHPWSLSRNTLDEIWNSEDLKKIRSDLKNGIKNSYCQLCWNEEAGKRASQRIRDIESLSRVFDFEKLEDEAEQPRYLVLKLGHTCNLRCRTCGSHSSSKWIDEEYATDPALQKTSTLQDYRKSFRLYSDSYSDENPIWANLEKYLPKVKQIDMYVGEPFLVNKQWSVLEKSYELGFSKDQVIHFNTNGTIWPEAKIDLLKNFKRVMVSFSVDGIGKRFEYIRDLAKWSVVLSHMEKAQLLHKSHPNFEFNVCITISNFNAFYLDEIINFFSENDIRAYLNLVHYPEAQCITNLPASIKKTIAEKVRAQIPQNHYLSDSLNHILNFMNEHSEQPSLFANFKKQVQVHDQYRSQSFKETNPEYAELLDLGQ